jgi:hypothetical protein
MYMATVALTATDEAPNRDIDPKLVTGIIWALAGLEHALEHVHAISHPGRIDIVVFHLVSNGATARFIGHRLCQLAITTSPQLSGWRICS